MTNQYDAIYLSPHLDDAALSCGGQIFQATAVGQRILILTIMAGNPAGSAQSGYADMLHERWQLGADVVAQRRVEDIAACHILGADYQHWTVPDCIYRTDAENKPLYEDWAEITGSIHPADEPLVEALAKRLAQLPPHGRIIAPLTVGKHVDHQIVRQAAEMGCGDDLFYYEDYPYVQIPGMLAEIIPPESPEWTAVTIPLSAEALQVKARAIEAYVSQVSTFFNGRDDLLRQITSYAQSAGGERLWRKR
ncbi:MAG: PIG-L family deacetylase [Chloroflexi bacterium]|nr:PIG-L family deacetylase [Chloroflexota bacterium]